MRIRSRALQPVLIESLFPGDGLQFQCTGTVINSRYILTAAFCVVDRNIAGVRIGEYNIAEEYDCVSNVCENSLQVSKKSNDPKCKRLSLLRFTIASSRSSYPRQYP